MGVQIYKDRVPLPHQYNTLRKKVGWKPVDEKFVITAFRNSLLTFTAFEDKQFVGMARLVGDGALYLYLQDVIVDPEFQNKGIGRKILEEIQSELKILTSLSPDCFIGLMADPSLFTFYEKFGYAENPKGYQLMGTY